MNAKEKAELKDIQAKLKEMAQPGYYGAWCAGYLRNHLQQREKELLAKKDKPVKRAEVTLKAILPEGYHWIARQPFGTWTAFKEKPTICRDVANSEVDDNGKVFVPTYWARQDDEIELCEGPQGGDWKKSAKRV